MIKPCYRDTMRIPPHDSCVGNLFIACVIAKSYMRGKQITAQDLMDRFGMSRATAFRWVKALKEANGAVAKSEQLRTILGDVDLA